MRNKYNSILQPARRRFLQSSTALAAMSGLGGLGAFIASPAFADGHAAGMTGGPTGFDGAERFQYNNTMSEGRAIEGIKALQAAGNAPQKLTMLLTDGAIGQITEPFPEGAPSVKEVWERETGITIDIIGASADDIFKKVMQDVTTGDGTFDIYTGPWNSTGDLVASGGAVNNSAFVAKYQPDWGDPERGTPTKEMEQLLYTYAGDYYSFSLDGDFQTWFYLKGLYEKPEVQEAFMKETGQALAAPGTWEDVDRISKFFTGKDLGNGTMYGNGNLMSPFWGLSTFYMRFVSMDFPNHYFFDEDANPQLNSDLGIQCAEEHVRSFEWCPPRRAYLHLCRSLCKPVEHAGGTPSDVYQRGEVRRRLPCRWYAEVQGDRHDRQPSATRTSVR